LTALSSLRLLGRVQDKLQAQLQSLGLEATPEEFISSLPVPVQR